jgi:hypothetical protein
MMYMKELSKIGKIFMFKNLAILAILFTLSACDLEEKLFPKQPFEDGPKIWTFIQYHVPEKEGGFEDYYYFGLVNENLYQKIKRHEIKDGLIFMEQVKYWNTEDVIESYEDEIYSDEMAFRIEDIIKFELVKKEPVVGFSYSKDELIEENNESDEIHMDE